MSFETVLGANQLELSGAGHLAFDTSLTMAKDPATGQRAFRWVYPDPGPETPVTAYVVLSVEVMGWSEPDCQGTMVCGGATPNGWSIPFAPPVSLAGGDLVFEPGGHDAGAIEQLLTSCDCGTEDVVSVEIRVTARLVHGRTVHAPQFKFCTTCGDVRG